jgi:tetratricopeptide (TPR) repeat protein
MAHTADYTDVPSIAPFWQRLPLFFRYPLHWEPLFYMALLSAATLLAFVLPVPAPFDFLLVLLGVWLAFIRYAYKTLDQTAHGLLTPDQHRQSADKDRDSLPYKQFAIFMALAFVVGLAQSVGSLVFGAALIFSVLTLPASVMILSITRSFWAGLNPFASIAMMRMIGLPYLGLCAFLFLLSASEEMLQATLLPMLPGWLLLPALNFVAMYFTLIMFNMMGYVVYQYHHLLGVKVSTAASVNGGKADSRSNRGEDRGASESADAIGRLIGAGQIDEALDLAYEAQRVAPDDLAALGRYYKLLVLAGREDRLLSHSRRYLSALLQKNQGDEALEVYRSMKERVATFEPDHPAQLLQLAEVTRRRREFPQALALLKGFDKRFPRHAEIPAVYLFAARVLCENLRQEAAARQILSVLFARYPEHPVSEEGRQLLAVLDKLASAPRPA